jgi:NADH dehydrogenase
MNASTPQVRSRPRIVIVGAGFGGLNAVQTLRHTPADIVLIDRRNHHLFQPLLYQVATAGLSPAEIAAPVRRIVRGQRNVSVRLGEVNGVNLAQKRVLLADHEEPYDYLVVATGARHAYFGHDEWEPFAPGLKTLEDAVALRRRILLAFERAEASDDQAERQRLLTFIIVGAGPTGVELAGALSELARKALAADFRRIDTRMTRILLIEAGPRVLATFPEDLSNDAAGSLRKLGVEIRTGAAVTQVDERCVMVASEHIDAGTVIWGAGVAASPAARWLGVESDRAGRVLVRPDLSISQAPGVFVIGDVAHAVGARGRPLPGIATVAKQQGRYVGRVLDARVRARVNPPPFRYRNLGNLATIGRRSAVVDFGWLRLHGYIAWVIWCVAHVYFLIGFRNRVVVTLDWIISYVTFSRGARLITGEERTEQED